ncbi:hypothetical protein ALC62_09081 [Cyphomyrmex costatus]|uniref:Tc1-like transposase DDE domain-containing protein n=1 Tax=Cyphomyrmex costatus TaxID=456900 RepID=A0A151IFZ4_9HYME|nr:hypothetical protein ALC62_09081 [Cyphomyrmex costatus]
MTVQRILQEEKLHAFHYTRVQHLQPEDYRERRTFCIFNSHNMHLWSDENPTATRPRSFQIRWKRNLWAGIMGTEILGPVVLPDILNGERYLELLRENLPKFLEEVPLLYRNKIVFQQDGAGLHNARIVTNYLNEQFPRC